MDTTANAPSGGEDIPTTDLPDETAQPETQGTEPIDAELGDDGQGDLAPEDLGTGDPDAGPDGGSDAAPQDLRTEIPPAGVGDAGDLRDGSDDLIGDGA